MANRAPSPCPYHVHMVYECPLMDDTELSLFLHVSEKKHKNKGYYTYVEISSQMSIFCKHFVTVKLKLSHSKIRRQQKGHFFFRMKHPYAKNTISYEIHILVRKWHKHTQHTENCLLFFARSRRVVAWFFSHELCALGH